ncbi:hypothetical protein GGR50DRAFT_702012 [Xylaria sp. CBS 124048]|nr:hypothetical protein GGR50DRAFT_702012 [Xylaria sp. CBS 124048]
MPIGDLLAEISGGPPSSAPSPKPATPSGVKRKAEDVSNGTSSKLTKARQLDGSYSTSKVTRDGDGKVIERAYSVSRPVKTGGPAQAASTKSSTLPHRTTAPSSKNGQRDSPVSACQRDAPASSNKLPSTASTAISPKRPPEASVRSKPNPPAPATTKAPSSKPSSSTSTPTPSDPSRAPPKRGSFKEIMARAAKAQETMGKVGMIQHRSTDKGILKKERETANPAQKPGTASGAKAKIGRAYSGTGRPSTATARDNGRVGSSSRAPSRNGPVKDAKEAKDAKTTSKPKPGSATNNATDSVTEKKVKKSATATTGYAGTARPRPGAAVSKGPASQGGHRPSRGGLLDPPRMNRRSKYEDEYDDDLDDFIDYDEDDEDVGPQYGYNSDGSSDMEAGLSDIDTEERRAELFAREEDRREQMLEEKLKKEKEQRKQRWAQGGQ